MEEENTVDLIYCLSVLKKRVWLLFVFPILMFFSVLVYELTSPPVFRSEVVIKVGKTQAGYVIDPGSLSVSINGGGYDLSLSDRGLKNIGANNTSGTDIISIFVDSESSEISQKAVNDLAQLLVVEQNEKIDSFGALSSSKKESAAKVIGFYEELLGSISDSIRDTEVLILDSKRKILEIEKEIAGLVQEKESLASQPIGSSQTNEYVAAIFSIEGVLEVEKVKLEGERSSLNDLESRLNDLEFRFISTKIEEERLRPGLEEIEQKESAGSYSEIIQEAKTLQLKSNFLFRSLVAVSLGLLIGITLSFALEWWKKVKTRI